MKALLIIDDDTTSQIASFYLKPMGMDIIRYRDPLKALDNLDEIQPEAIIMSACDFPRHWKPIVVNIRSLYSKNECVIVLLKGKYFPFEEAAKAAHLGVNGVIREDLGDDQERTRFQQLFKRYIQVDEARSTDRRPVARWDKLDFVFTHPVSQTLLTGRVESISSSGLSMSPDHAGLCADLEPGLVIEDASMRIGDQVVSLNCKLQRSGAILAFSFENLSAETADTLRRYLAATPERQMKTLKAENS
ncbi:MAG: hypothetical protein A2087_08165 [Spirochaetes bacterium GWD1_61_31]|nr:MAG: hypothetical protein A2Y37_12970 [Spirochaetes bacterium GWB1_60_80]OHD31955.1 MAG: hypothetical protein A2004_02900 [Spirochaetes bacterium GWC1_61_12]OHD42118.1 MAG: hypothetical protein A2087_08165 [Spirochaetes bacterium GWD1_61_31]OHD43335.1 MAG: hypothetical protein A2Y35_08665 [Spirochaetes bacterium GWE1_60_18]OHD58874.1 MAG: hypothetical protein A2Y32_09035 [Spirochaetes bacterium GWF1_60_12]HAP42529.1 pilus assembly protein PilZ [Spirochaetaceae bacterium]